MTQATTIDFSGSITQSTQDGTGPAVNNPSLNNISDGQTFAISLSTPTDIASPGTYNLGSAILSFSVPGAPAAETDFNSVSLTITSNGTFDVFSLVACVGTGSGCAFGNQLTANFQIAASQFDGLSVAATGLDQPHPLDLLEDDGITDIQASISNYSGPASTVPEPGLGPLCVALVGFGAWRRKLRHQSL